MIAAPAGGWLLSERVAQQASSISVLAGRGNIELSSGYPVRYRGALTCFGINIMHIYALAEITEAVQAIPLGYTAKQRFPWEKQGCTPKRH